MCLILAILVSFLAISMADVSPNSFCMNMNPQQHIRIEQLMGIWYGIEILMHNVDEHYLTVEPSCPILHLSEDRSHPPTTYNPRFKNYNYRYNYGERRPYDTTNEGSNYDNYNYFGRTSTPYPYNRNYDRRYGTRNDDARYYPDETKRITIWWDENGSETTYHLRYHTHQPGFWISSGPQNGSELEPIYGSFAGTVQVLKAVGSHLVLTFCHRLPDKQLFTILLSREHKLDFYEVYSVHTLLNRRGLSTSAIKKVCGNSSRGLKNSIFGLALVVLALMS